ncbi:hypothetical protein PVAG01_10342 [Phlyctema vagabunda]|uniref:Uncharacterized protein n=1 Tax=Phlyctema vagabunda TaxID=108571 RepID=A0ABR4P684_9HELO
MSCTTTTTVATAPITNPQVKTSKLSATSPIFIPGTNISFDPKTNKVLSKTGPIKKPSGASSSIKKPVPSTPKLWFPTFNTRPPIPTPDESLSQWRARKDSIPITAEAQLYQHQHQQATSYSSEPPISPRPAYAITMPSKREFAFITADEYLGVATSTAAAAEQERHEYEARARRIHEDGLRAIRGAMFLHSLNRAGIVARECKISAADVWLWEHPTFGPYRCANPSPLRSSLTFKQ